MPNAYTVSSGVVTLDDLIARKAQNLALYPMAIDIDICSNLISGFDNEAHQAMLQLALRAFCFPEDLLAIDCVKMIMIHSVLPRESNITCPVPAYETS